MRYECMRSDVSVGEHTRPLPEGNHPVERATPRRRTPRKGSLTVATLLDEATVPGTASPPAAGGDTRASGDRPTPTGHRHTSLGTAGRVAGMGLGVLALCSALGAASIIAGNHDRERSGLAVQPASTVTGAQALRPDELASRLPTAPAAGAATGRQGSGTGPDHRATSRRELSENGDTGSPAGTSTPSTSTTEPSEDTATTHDATMHASTADTTSPRSSTTTAPADVVGTFYRLLGNQPGAAAELLDPRLLGSGVLDFVHSWTHTRAIRVEQVTQRSQDTVEAVIRVLQPDGSWLRLRQLVTLAGGGSAGTVPAIEDVTLLSAQRG